MTPQTVNALNIPLQNALNFPAAILEAPFFNPKADAAANYAAIGSVIGHEISHRRGTPTWPGWRLPSTATKPRPARNHCRRWAGSAGTSDSFSLAWRQKIRDEALRQQIVTNGHAPDRERAQTVRNIDAWYDAYSVKEGQKLYLAPNDRVKIW